MDCAPDIATTLEAWLRHFDEGPSCPSAVPPAPTFHIAAPPADPSVTVAALAALAAEALARDRTLWIVTADDSLLPDISNALDLRLRPLCLVLPGAEYASTITLRATLSLLKSRLARAAADSEGPAWTAMRARLQADDTVWRASLAWSTRGLDRETPPAGIRQLFPIRIGPCPRADAVMPQTDWVILVQARQLPANLCTAWPGARCTLLLGADISGRAGGLVPLDETVRLRAELEVLGQELAEMELELATAQAELATFTEHYHALIAGRMAELDRLLADLAQAGLRRNPDDPELHARTRQTEERAEQSRRERDAYRNREERAATPRFAPGDDLKKRFRQLAQKIHPDRANNEVDRAWRTQLMSEANRAYRAGDAAALEEVFALWLAGQHVGAPAHAGAGAPAPNSAVVAALTAEIAAIKRRLASIAAELDRLYGSKLYELFAAARVAARQGRDLLAEMARRLDSQIDLAKAGLDSLDTAV